MGTVRITREMVEKATAKIDWAAVDAITDEDIARQIAENPDAAPDLTDPKTRLLMRVGSPHLKTRQKFRLVRRALGLSQAQFASAYHIPLRTLQNWEQGTREPDEASQALLKLIADDPERTRRVLSGF